MSAAHRAVLEQIREAAPRSSLTTEAAALRRRCLGEKDAAADQRHQQALGEWEAQSWTRRRTTGRPKREHPGPPNRHDLAAARDQLVAVVRSAMMTELEKLMPQPRPASPPADGARTPPAAAAARRDQLQVERPALPRGSAKFRSAPRTRGPNRRRRRRRPPRLRETGDMNQAADRYPRRVGRVLPGDRPVPVRAAGRRLRSRWTAAPIRTARTLDLRRPGPFGGTAGGLGGWYDRSIM